MPLSVLRQDSLKHIGMYCQIATLAHWRAASVNSRCSTLAALRAARQTFLKSREPRVFGRRRGPNISQYGKLEIADSYYNFYGCDNGYDSDDNVYNSDDNGYDSDFNVYDSDGSVYNSDDNVDPNVIGKDAQLLAFVACLMEKDDKAAIATLSAYLGDEAGDVRNMAALSLAVHSGEHAINAVSAQLEHNDVIVREKATQCLVMIAAEAGAHAVAALSARFKDSDAWVLEEAGSIFHLFTERLRHRVLAAATNEIRTCTSNVWSRTPNVDENDPHTWFYLACDENDRVIPIISDGVASSLAHSSVMGMGACMHIGKPGLKDMGELGEATWLICTICQLLNQIGGYQRFLHGFLTELSKIAKETLETAIDCFWMLDTYGRHCKDALCIWDWETVAFASHVLLCLAEHGVCSRRMDLLWGSQYSLTATHLRPVNVMIQVWVRIAQSEASTEDDGIKQRCDTIIRSTAMRALILIAAVGADKGAHVAIGVRHSAERTRKEAMGIIGELARSLCSEMQVLHAQQNRLSMHEREGVVRALARLAENGVGAFSDDVSFPDAMLTKRLRVVYNMLQLLHRTVEAEKEQDYVDLLDAINFESCDAQLSADALSCLVKNITGPDNDSVWMAMAATVMSCCGHRSSQVRLRAVAALVFVAKIDCFAAIRAARACQQDTVEAVRRAVPWVISRIKQINDPRLHIKREDAALKDFEEAVDQASQL